MSFQTFKKQYTFLSILIANSIVLLVVLNVFSYWSLPHERAPEEGQELKRALHKYGLFPYLDKDIYNGRMSKDDIVTFFQNESDLDIQYEPYSMFAERKGYTSRFINVSRQGFRKNERTEDILTTRKKKIFVLGGSTTFGYGVADRDTFPSYLQEDLAADYAVFNFGRAYYYSRQQLVLLLNLLEKGWKPDVVVVLDGVNERPYNIGPSLNKAYADRLQKSKDWLSVDDFAVVKMALKVVARLQRAQPAADQSTFFDLVNTDDAPDTKNPAADEVDAYFRTVALLSKICAANNIELFVFYQPLSIYQHDYKRYHPFYKDVIKSKADRIPVYEEINRRVRNHPVPRFFSLTNLGQDEKRPLFVDGVHYNPYFNKKIAGAVAAVLKASARPE